MASVVKIVIENFLLVAHLSIIHTRFNLCCRIEMGWVFFVQASHIIMKISKGGLLHQILPIIGSN